MTTTKNATVSEFQAGYLASNNKVPAGEDSLGGVGTDYANCTYSGLITPHIASAAIVAGRIVYVDATGTIAVTTGAEVTALGVAVDAAGAAADEIRVLTMGIGTVTADGSGVSAGDKLVAGAAGVVTTYAGGSHANTQCIGMALEDIAAGETGKAYIMVNNSGE